MTDNPTYAANPGIRIEAAIEADVPVVLDLIRALAEYERLAADVVTSEAALRETLFGPHRRAEAVIAWVDGVPAGFAVWFHNYSTFLGRAGLYLEDLFVRPEFRRRGVGKALFTRLARTAVDRGCGRMEWSVLDWNTPAIGFYRRRGAHPLDEWTVFRLKRDALEAVARSSD